MLFICTSIQAAGVRVKAEHRTETTARVSYGSGCFIEKNRVVTAWHVIDGGGDIYVEIDGDWIRAKVIKHDAKTDLALLQTKAESKDVVKLVKAEQWTVSASDESQEISVKSAGNFGGTITSKVKNGNSGGPLLNGKGELVGIVLARSLDEESGYYISADLVRAFLKD